MARYRYMQDDGRNVIDVTGDETKNFNLIDVTAERPPVVEGLMIDTPRNRMPAIDPAGQFNEYQANSPRRIGTMPGGERVGFTGAGARNIMAADRRLQGDFGGVQINDGEYAVTGADGARAVRSNMPEGFAPIMSRDSRLALSPEAIAGLGRTQLEEEIAAQAMQRTGGQQGVINTVRGDMQRVADMGFVPEGTDLMRKRQMRGTLIDAREDWQDNNRPRDLMTRRNTADQIMTQADASLRTPQVMTQDGVATGWDPRQQKIVTDSSGARAMAVGRVKDDTITGISDDDLNNRLIALKARQIGELDDMDKLRVDGLLRSGDKAGAAKLKEQLQKSKWSPDMQPYYDQYQAEWERRNGKKAPAAGGKGGKWALK